MKPGHRHRQLPDRTGDPQILRAGLSPRVPPHLLSAVWGQTGALSERRASMIERGPGTALTKPPAGPPCPRKTGRAARFPGKPA